MNLKVINRGKKKYATKKHYVGREVDYNSIFHVVTTVLLY